MNLKSFAVAFGAGALICASLCVSALLIHAQEEKPKEGSSSGSELKIRKLELVNADGVTVLSLNTDEHGCPVVQVTGAKGKAVRLQLGVDADGIASVRMNDARGNPVAVLFSGLKEDELVVNGLNVLDSKGVALAEFFATEAESHIALRDTRGYKRVGMGSADDKTGVILCDREGEPRMVMEVSGKGDALMELKETPEKSAYKWTSKDK
jgi:hypothetical protein